MRFHHTQSPPPFLNRPAQRRMLGLTLMLAVVVVGVHFAAKPESWHWFFRIGQGTTSTTPQGKTLDDVDFRVKEPGHELPPGTFLAEATPPAPIAPPPGDAQATSTEVPPDLFKEVEDNRLGALRREQPALDYLLDKVRQLPLETMERAARDGVAFASLMIDTNDYRGQIVNLKGILRRLTPLQRPGQDPTQDHVYEGWMFTPDSADNPCRILVVDLPPGMPVGEAIDEDVQVTAYMFKRYGYVSQGGQHVAPMLIGKTFHWLPRPQEAPSQVRDNAPRFLVMFLIGAVVLVGTAVTFLVVSDRRFRRTRWKQITVSQDAAVRADLASLSSPEPVESGPREPGDSAELPKQP